MTRVRISLAWPDQSGVDAPATGILKWRPTMRRNVTGDDAHVVLPAAFPAPLGAGDDEPGTAVVGVEPTGPGWVWEVHEGGVVGGSREPRFFVVPDVESIAYGDLVEVDPRTLEPAAVPEAAWWAALVGETAARAAADLELLERIGEGGPGEGGPGGQGPAGRGIVSIERTDGDGAPGTTDTFTITYTSGSPTQFSVYNGRDGGEGDDGRGIESIEKTGSVALIDTYTVTYSSGPTSTFTVANGAAGAPGDDGRGIVTINKTTSDGLIDTYTITYTDDTTSTFEINNGAPGAPDSGSAIVPQSHDIRRYAFGTGMTLKADGTGDNSALYQAAVNTLGNLYAADGIPRQIWTPNGKYRTVTKLTWKPGVGIAGESMGGVTFLPVGNQSFIEGTDRGRDTPYTDCQFNDFTIDGALQTNATYSTGIKGIFIQFMDNATWTNVTVKNTWGSGFGVDFLKSATFRNCVADNCGRGVLATGASRDSALGGSGFGIGTGAYAVENVSIIGCTASNNGVHGIFTERQVAAKAGIDPPLLSDGLRVIGCRMEGNWIGFRDAGSKNADVTGNQMVNNQKAGALLDRTTLSATSGTHGLLSENVIAGNGTGDPNGGGVVMGYMDGGHYTLKNNKIHDNTGFGIRALIGGATTFIGDHVKIVANEIYDNTRSGVFAGNSSAHAVIADLLIKANQMWGNGTDTSSAQRANIVIDSSTTRLRILGNELDGSPAQPIVLSGARTATDLTIFGNDLRNNVTPGVLNNHTLAGSTLIQNIGDFSAGGYTDEQVRDVVAAMFGAGTKTGITFNFDDAGDKVDVTVTGGTGGGSIVAGSILGAVATPDASTTPKAAVGGTATDFGASTLAITVPTSGKIKWRFAAPSWLSASSGTAGAQMSLWDVTDPLNPVIRGSKAKLTTTTANLGNSVEQIVTGLTAGATMTLQLRYEVTTQTLFAQPGVFEVVAL